MEQGLPIWEPTAAEVAQIVDELRPLIRGFARRDEQAMVAAGDGSISGWESRLHPAECC